MEIELKLLVEEPIAREKILKDKHLKEIKDEESEQVIRMKAYYLDTDDFDLCRGGIAFRIRLENGTPVATLKWGNETQGSLHIRGELNVHVDEKYVESPSLDIFKGSEIYEEIRRAAGDKPLKPIMEVACTRKQMMVDTGRCICAVSLDVGEIITPRGSAPVSELEVELYSGEKDDMIALGNELAAKYNLKEGAKSKFQVGLELLKL